MTHDFPTLQEILAIHQVLISEFGGAQGIRDEGALLSALMRPQLGYYDTLIAEAAALMESLANNHPFIDGNKRVAFASADVFLRINGFRIQGEPTRLHADMIAMFDTGSFDFARLDPWLRGLVGKRG